MLDTLIDGKWEQRERLSLSEAFLESSLRPQQGNHYRDWDLMLSAIAQVPDQERQDFHIAARDLGYKKFLKSLYWRIVRRYLRTLRSGLCQFCNAPESLQVHHASYEFRGSDHLHLDKLVLLCDGCHEQHHFPNKRNLEAQERRKIQYGRYASIRRAGEILA